MEQTTSEAPLALDFDFRLSALKLLPYWLLYVLLFVLPIRTVISESFSLLDWRPFFYFILAYFFFMLYFNLILSYMLYKLSIGNLVIKGAAVRFRGSALRYSWQLFLGTLYMLATFGLYLPFFIKRLYAYLVNKTSYKDIRLRFRGSAWSLGLILLLSYLLPTCALFYGLYHYIWAHPLSILKSIRIAWHIFNLLWLPATYFTFKWMCSIEYLGNRYQLRTSFWKDTLFLIQMLFLSLFSFGLYFPFAIVKTYAYFVQHLRLQGDHQRQLLSYQSDDWSDYVFMLKNIALTLLSIGLYVPWFLCNFFKRMLNRTHILQP